MATEVNKILLEVELDAKGVVKNTDQVNAQLKKLGVNADLVNTKLKGTRDASGAAGAAVAEFGRLVSDAPYGIQAVTNNLSQLGSMFAVTAANAGGAKNAVGEMINVVFKAGRVTMVGWLIAFQAVIAAIDFFTRSTKKAKEEFADFNIQVESQVLNLNEVLRALEGNNASLQKQIELLRTFSGLNEELIDLYEEGKISQEDITLAVQAQLAVAEAKKKLNDDDKKILKEINTILEERPDLAELEEDLIKKRNVLNKITDKSVNADIRREELNSEIRDLEDQINNYGKDINDKLLGRNDALIEIVRAQAVLADLEEKYLNNLSRGNMEIQKRAELVIDAPDGVVLPEELLAQAAEGMDEDLAAIARGNAITWADEFFAAVEKGAALERFAAIADIVSEGLSVIGEVFDAEYDRQLVIEENKTIAQNDELKRRLANEQLSADARDQINQQIARNDAKLVEKQNEIGKRQFQIEKAFKIVTALADIPSMMSKAYLSQLTIPSPKAPARALLAAKIAGAFGLAQVAALTRLKYQEQGLPTPNLTGPGLGGLESGGPQFNVVGASGQSQLAEAVTGALTETPIRSYVVASDVTTAQQLDRNIVEGASI